MKLTMSWENAKGLKNHFQAVTRLKIQSKISYIEDAKLQEQKSMNHKSEEKRRGR